MDDLNRQTWNRYIASRPHAQFLQSWEWGEFQESLGFPAYHARGDASGDAGTDFALFLELPLFSGSTYFYCPRGPVECFSDALFGEVQKVFTKQLRRKPLFLRCEPTGGDNGGVACPRRGRRVLSVQPDREWLLDLSKGESEIFSQMHPKTRYNIRLASKKNVQVRRIDQDKDALEQGIGTLYGFLENTASSKEYRLHKRPYYHSLITFFTQHSNKDIAHDVPVARLFEATVEGIAVASGCMIYFGDTVYYLYGGSDPAYSALMAPYALHAHAIRDAIQAGYRYYNFGGISPQGADRHSLTGVTRFKMGFGGEHILYPGTFDIVLNNAGYMAYQMGRPLWRMFNRVRS